MRPGRVGRDGQVRARPVFHFEPFVAANLALRRRLGYAVRMRVSFVVGMAAVALFASGCIANPFGSTSDSSTSTTADLPGTLIGTYGVTAIETANSCGEGALGETADWSFTVSFSEDGSTVYWNSGNGPITGVLGSDGISFSFVNSIVTDMRTSTTTSDPQTSTGFWGAGGGTGTYGLPACSVERDDAASGFFSGDVVTSSTSALTFSGSLIYEYSPTPGSSCEDLVTGSPTAAPQFLALPCSMAFTLGGTRE
jgi:hypothetical protein